jgi:uncharacterized protein YndB with AHSA1/START domain
MENGLVAKAVVVINAPAEKVWEALVTPELVKKYFFGVAPETDWGIGSGIVWKGEWQGKPFEDKGKILEVVVNHTLRFTHFSPLSGKPDMPENYHTIAITLEEDGTHTILTLSQDNNSNNAEREHSTENWVMVLDGLKKVVEQ